MAGCTLIDRHNVTFLNGEDPYEDNLKRKSIFFAVLLKLNFWVPGRSTKMTRSDSERLTSNSTVVATQLV